MRENVVTKIWKEAYNSDVCKLIYHTGYQQEVDLQFLKGFLHDYEEYRERQFGNELGSEEGYISPQYDDTLTTFLSLWGIEEIKFYDYEHKHKKKEKLK